MSISIYNSTTIPLLAGESFEGLIYDNILEFAEINISVNCDVGYTIFYIYSQNKINYDFIQTETIAASAQTTFIRRQVLNRYFKIRIEATDGDMTSLNVQTIYKPTISYQVGSGVSSDVNVLNFPSVQPVSGTVSISNSSINTKITDQTAGLSLDSTLQSINEGQKTVGGGKVWDLANVVLNGVSSTITGNLVYGSNYLSIYGYSDTTSTITIQLSNDNINFYKTQYTYNLSVAGDFGFSVQMPFKYMRLINTGQNINSIIAYVNYK
jgi:hypothetical protein